MCTRWLEIRESKLRLWDVQLQTELCRNRLSAQGMNFKMSILKTYVVGCSSNDWISIRFFFAGWSILFSFILSWIRFFFQPWCLRIAISVSYCRILQWKIHSFFVSLHTQAMYTAIPWCVCPLKNFGNIIFRSLVESTNPSPYKKHFFPMYYAARKKDVESPANFILESQKKTYFSVNQMLCHIR